MSYSVAANYASAMLRHLGDIANGNDPGTKVTPQGFTRMLIENNPAIRILDEGYLGNGHLKNVRISYQPRYAENIVDTTESCDIGAVPSYNEFTTPLTKYVQTGLYVDDRAIARYNDEASALVTPSGASPVPSGSFMAEHIESIKHAANALFQKINRILLTTQESNWGTNVENAATTKNINFDPDGTVNDLSTGITEILNDVMLNEMVGTPIFVGGGLFNKYWLQQVAKSADSAGVNTAAFQGAYKWYFDLLSQSVWGANEIGVFSPGSVIGILNYNKYKGSFAGDKLTSFNFTMPIPVSDTLGNSMGTVVFDAKLLRINCPETVDVGPYNVPTTVSEGWKLILSKQFDSINIPTDAYASSDRLTGNNGTLRYVIQNS